MEHLTEDQESSSHRFTTSQSFKVECQTTGELALASCEVNNGGEGGEEEKERRGIGEGVGGGKMVFQQI